MKCVICKNGEPQPGVTTVTLERDAMTLVIKGVPARVCPNCGEEYLDESVTERLLSIVDQAALAGVQVDIRRFVAA